MLVIVRLAFGGMEAALNPAITTALARWVPDNWRATAFGMFIGGGRVGGAFAPALAVFLLLHYGWRSTFMAIAGAGVVAAGVWLLAVPPNLPANLASKTFERAGARLWSFRLSAFLLVAFCYTFMWQFYATWFPTYLIERRGYTLSQAAWYASLPFLLGIGSNWVGGILCDAISRKIGPALGRGILGFCSMLFAALLFYCGIIGSAAVSPWLLSAAAGVGDLFLPIAWTVAADLGGRSAGAFSGLMNSASSLGGFVSPILLGAAIQHWKNWDSALLIGVGATVLAACLWIPVNWPSSAEERLII